MRIATQVVSSQQVADARAGSWAIHLSEHRTVPREWFLRSRASGSCAWRLVADSRRRSSPRPARRSRCWTGLLVSSARTLSWQSGTGLSCDLCRATWPTSAFGGASFDLVVNPISTLFVPDVGKVWREVAASWSARAS